MYRKFFTLLSVIAIVGLSSCQKEQDLIEERPAGNAFEQLNVPTNFTWRTHQDVSLHITGPYTGLVTVKKADGSAVMKVNLTQNTPLALQFGVPAYEEKLYIHYAGKEVEIELTGAPIHYSFSNKSDETSLKA